MASRHLLNPLATLGTSTPSERDGVPPALERDLRAFGALLIQQAGVMLKAPQVVMATAQVLFQRFWFVTSMKHFGIRDMGLGALFLASKLEESPLRIRDLINSYDYLLSLIQYLSHPSRSSEVSNMDPSSYTTYQAMDYFATEFYDRKEALVIAEMQILKRLGFQTQVGLPYGHLINYLQVMELANNAELVDMAWGFVNDMLQTPIPALYPQSTIALSSIYLTCRLQTPQVALPLTPVPWWTLFDANEEEIISICETLLRLYKDWGHDLSFGPLLQDPVEGTLATTSNAPLVEAGERPDLQGRDGASSSPSHKNGSISAKAATPIKISIWRKAASLPIDKKGVRERLIDVSSRGFAVEVIGGSPRTVSTNHAPSQMSRPSEGEELYE